MRPPLMGRLTGAASPLSQHSVCGHSGAEGLQTMDEGISPIYGQQHGLIYFMPRQE